MECGERFLGSRIAIPSSPYELLSISYGQSNELLDYSIKNYNAMLTDTLVEDKRNLTNFFKYVCGIISKKKELLISSITNIHQISEISSLNIKLLTIKDKIKILFNKISLLFSPDEEADTSKKELIESNKTINEEIDHQLKILEEKLKSLVT